MKTKISIPIVMLFCLLVGQVKAEETPPIVETYACNLAGGSDAGDVQEAIDFWKEQIDEIDNKHLNKYAAWLVTPIRSSSGMDLYWLGASPNLNTWAKGGAAYAASSEGQAAQARFDEILSCGSQVWSSEQLMGPEEEDEDGNGVVEAYGCVLHEGKTMANVRAVESNYVKEAQAAGIEQAIFRFSPMYTDGQVDLIYLVGYDDMEAFGEQATDAYSNDGTRTANAYFGLVMDCAAGIYNIDTIKAADWE